MTHVFEKPNAQVNQRQCGALTSALNRQLDGTLYWWQADESFHVPGSFGKSFIYGWYAILKGALCRQFVIG